MHNRRAFLSLLVSAVTLATPVMAASQKGTASQNSTPSEYSAQLDGPLAIATGPGGKIWAAWAMHAPGEFDIAVSSREVAGGWSVPAYLGHRDRVDEVDPSLVVDQNGSVYVAFATRGSSRIFVSALVNGFDSWLGPVMVSGDDRATSPVIRIVAGQVVIAYRTVRGVEITELPLLVPAQILGIQDGPTGVDPLGMVPKWEEKRQSPSDQEEPPQTDGELD